MSLIYFLLLIGALVVVHEFGHFVAAKLLDFKVLRFSIGFGRPLVRVRRGETEYQVGIVPLGGYVRIFGEGGDADDDDDDGPADETDEARDRLRSFSAKPLWQRLVVVFAGPAANLMFPVLIYFIFFAGHSQLPAAVVGDVIDGGPAARAGIAPGDRVLSVGGEQVRYWEQLKTVVDANVGRELHFEIRRDGRAVEKYLVPVQRTVRSRDGRTTREGWIGVSQAPFRPQIGVIDASSPAARAGLRTGDTVISVDGVELDSWTELRHALRGDARRKTIAYLRGEPVPGIPHVRLLEPRIAGLVPETRAGAGGRYEVHTGLAPAEMFVAHVDSGSPAGRAGLQAGDLVTALDGEPIAHWMLLDQALQRDPDRAWQLTWLRPGADGRARRMTRELVQERRREVDEYGNGTVRLAFGATNDFDRGEGELVDIEGRLSYAASKAVERTGDTIVEMTSGVWSILRGETPHESVGGPIMMYRVASVSGSKGLDAFLLMLALISVNLGLINLLPVPLLDGGNLVVFAIEGVTRRSLSPQARQRVMMCGLAVVAAITVLALRNDVVRYLIQ